jgi:hypothetical protein
MVLTMILNKSKISMDASKAGVLERHRLKMAASRGDYYEAA